MFNSAIIDVAIGMVFVYLLLSLMCSAANELVELWLKNRATDLERGLRELLKDPTGTGLVKKVYDHPLISGLFEGTYDPAALSKVKRALGRVKLPSYIPAQAFALALMDTVLPAQDKTASGTAASMPPPGATASSTSGLQSLRDNVAKLGNPAVEKALLSLIDAADNDVTTARENIEKWFNASMDRVSGWYKRRAQAFILILSVLVTVGVNADSVLIAKRLSADKALRDSLVSAAQDYAKVNAESAKSTAEPKPSPTIQPAKVSEDEKTRSPSGSTAESGAGSADGSSTTNSNDNTRSPSKTPGTNANNDVAANTNNDAGENSRKKAGDEAPKDHGEKNDNIDCSRAPNSPQCNFEKSLGQIKSLSLPIGWDSGIEGQQWPGLHAWEGKFWSGWTNQFRTHFLGWLLTVLAISLGAPFWFDMLNKFIVIRSTIKPHEKSGEEKSKDK